MKLLLMSSSRTAETGFLEANAAEIAAVLAGVDRAVFVPYAIVGEARPPAVQLVTERFAQFGVALENIAAAVDPVRAVAGAPAVIVSGGNTFCLLKALYDHGVMDVIRARVRTGAPYVGWSAGSNVAGRTMRTTNDMPIVHPPSFRALDLVPFQINPHYTDVVPPGWRGETRDQRLAEFLAENPEERVVALPEGAALLVRDGQMSLSGPHDAWLFRTSQPRERLAAGSDLSHLLR